MTNTPEDKKKEQLRFYAKYSGIAFKMLAICLVFIFAGRWLDQYLNTSKPYITLVMAVLGVSLAMYDTIKDLSK